MRRKLKFLLVSLFFVVMQNSVYAESSVETTETPRQVISQLSQDELIQLKKINYQSKTLLRKLHRSSDRGVSAGRSVLNDFNQQDRQLMVEYKLLRKELKSHKKQFNANGKSPLKQSTKASQQETALDHSLKQTKAQLKDIYTGKMQLIELLAAADDISVVNDLIESSRSAHPEALVHQSVFIGLAGFGALTMATDYAQEVLDDDASGVAELAAALMYLTYYPSPAAKIKAEEYVDADYHPYIRDMAAWLYAKLEGVNAKGKIVAAIEKSYIDRMGVESKYYGLLGLAEIVEPTEFTDLLIGKDYPNKLYQSALQYSQFKHGDDAIKESLIRNFLVSSMREEEQFQAMQFILENNRTDLLVELNVLIENSDGLTAIEPLATQIKQLGYQLAGSSDNPVITPFENE